jgi:hypothetical protein
VKDVRATIGYVGRAWLAALLLGSAGCDEGGGRSSLTIQVAAPSTLGGVCTHDTVAAEAPCSIVRLFRRLPDGDLQPVRIFRTGDDHEAAQGALELRFDGRKIAFDVRAEEARQDLVITVYGGRPATPLYGAHVEDVRFGTRELRVRLYPFR